MKGMKVTEAFELPLVIEFVENDEFTLRHESKRQFHAAFKNKDQAYVAANCINHADALADALAVMLIENLKHQFQSKESIQAAQTLAAYRGAK